MRQGQGLPAAWRGHREAWRPRLSPGQRREPGGAGPGSLPWSCLGMALSMRKMQPLGAGWNHYVVCDPRARWKQTLPGSWARLFQDPEQERLCQPWVEPRRPPGLRQRRSSLPSPPHPAGEPRAHAQTLCPPEPSARLGPQVPEPLPFLFSRA